MHASTLASPELFPIAFDPASGRTRFVRLDEAGYAAASFLDERLQAPEAGEAPLETVRSAAAAMAGECDFIFHTGHVGSTLVSRLLGRHPQVFSLREPAVLRTLARLEADPAGATAVFLRLWARTWRPGQKTLLKATSFAGEIGPELMRLHPSARAILMFVSPSVYMAGILAGDASREELAALAPSRLERLHRRLGAETWRLEDLGEGERTAMSWLAEVCALAAVAEAFPERILWLEFEAFLARPGPWLEACLRRLHGRADPAEAEALLAGPEMTRYSKAPEFAYDAALRRRVLAEAAREHAAGIERGIAWLNAAGGAHPPLARAMRLAGAAARAAAAPA